MILRWLVASAPGSHRKHLSSGVAKSLDVSYCWLCCCHSAANQREWKNTAHSSPRWIQLVIPSCWGSDFFFGGVSAEAATGFSPKKLTISPCVETVCLSAYHRLSLSARTDSWESLKYFKRYGLKTCFNVSVRISNLLLTLLFESHVEWAKSLGIWELSPQAE